MSGRALVTGAAGLFLAPLALAIAGAALAGHSQPRQAAGAVIGLLCGLVIAITVGKAVRRARTAHTGLPGDEESS